MGRGQNTFLLPPTYEINQQQADALTKQYIEDSPKILSRAQLLVSTFDPAKCVPEPK